MFPNKDQESRCLLGEFNLFTGSTSRPEFLLKVPSQFKSLHSFTNEKMSDRDLISKAIKNSFKMWLQVILQCEDYALKIDLYVKLANILIPQDEYKYCEVNYAKRPV